MMRTTHATRGGRHFGGLFGGRGKYQRGVAAIEFALIASTLGFLLLNMFDFAAYAYISMEVANAAEMGAQAAWQTCDTSKQPATTQCGTALTTAVTAAIQSTSLGSGVALAAGYPVEAYYCIDASNALTTVGSLASKPANCAAVQMPSLQPGDYIQIQVTYRYAPVIPGSLARFLPTTITGVSMMRLS